MATPLLTGLRDLREDLLRQLILTSGAEKTEILVKIMEMEEQIALEEKLLPPPGLRDKATNPWIDLAPGVLLTTRQQTAWLLSVFWRKASTQLTAYGGKPGRAYPPVRLPAQNGRISANKNVS